MPTSITGETRDLSYPLDRSLVAETITPNDIIVNHPFSWPSTDNDEQVTVTMTLSLNEYIALSSCIDVGDDIAFGENAILLWQIWVRMLNTMDFCEQVQNCVETNVNVQNSINTVIVQTGQSNPDSLGNTPEDVTGNDRLPDADILPVYEPPSCELDALWAGIREMVDRIDQNGRDVLEDLAVINDKIQQVSEIIDLVPLLGDVIKDIGDLFTEQLPDLLNAYNAASSPSFLDNVACDLFEMVCDECRYPTFDEVINYFGSLSYFSIPAFNTLNYVALWDLIKTVTGVTPEALWYSINVWQCITLAFNATFKQGYGTKSFAIWASFGEDNPNDNWMILCDGCGEQCELHDYRLSSGIVTAIAGNGNWIASQGWVAVDPFTTLRITLQFDFGQVVNVTGFTFKFNRAGAAFSTVNYPLELSTTWVTGSGEQFDTQQLQGTGEVEFTSQVLVPVQTQYLVLFFDVSGANNADIALVETCIEYAPI